MTTNLPDDLSPQEMEHLHRLVADVRRPVPETHYPGWHDPIPDGEGSEDRTDFGGDEPAIVATPPSPILDLLTGSGWWRGHSFTLSPDALRAVQQRAVEAIADMLTAEVARLRGETSEHVE